MKIAVVSGKGGTGKTYFATNLAVAVGAQLLDCDVEEPNAHLFISPKVEGEKLVCVKVPRIDLSKCTFCKKCAEVCAYNAIAVVGKQVLVFEELCHSCGACSIACPEQAIYEENRPIGVVRWGAGKGIELVYGVLNVGEPRATPVIESVKEMARDGGLVIIDGPPGTSCPAVEAMYGCDVAVGVVEPTPMGLHDFSIIADVCQNLSIKLVAVINKSGFGYEDVKSFCQKRGVPVVMEIPFSRRIAELYSRKRLLVEEESWRSRFAEALDKVSEVV